MIVNIKVIKTATLAVLMTFGASCGPVGAILSCCFGAAFEFFWK